MKVSHLSFLLLRFVPGSLAQNSLQSAVVELPSCALSCFATAVTHSSCSPTNQTCLCTNGPLQAELTICVTESCTVKEALTTKNITETTCGAPIRDRRGLYNNVSTTFGILTGIVVVLRLCSKLDTKSSQSNFWLDDLSVVVTLLSGIPGSVLNVHGLTANGLGKDIWTVTFKQITDFIHVFYVMEILYFAQVALLKLSILFFYLRIFPGMGIRRLIWMTIAFDAVFGTTFFFLAIFQCRPISFYWKRWDGEHAGKCFDVNAMAFGNASISIALDVWMLGLALSQIIHLNLHWKRKFGVVLMFSVGTFVTVISIVRLRGLVTFANSVNPTWDNWSTGLWSTIEINVGIICACMPSLRLLLVKPFPKVLGTNSTPPSDLNSHESGRSHAMESITGKSGKAGILYSQSYTVEHSNAPDDDQERLVQLKEVDAKFMKLAARDSEMRGSEGLCKNSVDDKSVARGLSSNFT